MEIKTYLAKSPLFSSLAASQLELIVEKIKAINYKKNSIVWHKDEKNTGLLILAIGLLKVVNTSKEGKEQILNTIHPHDWFGDMSIFDETTHSATVIALKDSTCLIIPKDEFLKFASSNLTVLLNMIKLLSDRVRILSRQVEELSFHDIFHRVAHKLEFLSIRNKTKEVEISHQELANLVSATRENVTRVLNKMSQMNLIKLKKGCIIINDLEKLKNKG